jgi:hypothetical protein
VGASPDRTCYRIHDVYAYAVNCLLIVGTTPERTDHKKSFELFRSMLHGVTVATVGELLAKLRSLHEFPKLPILILLLRKPMEKDSISRILKKTTSTRQTTKSKITEQQSLSIETAWSAEKRRIRIFRCDHLTNGRFLQRTTKRPMLINPDINDI